MINRIVQEITKLLPEIKKVKVRNELDYYGFSKYLAQKLQITRIPNRIVSFKHGWMIGELKYKEEIIMDEFSVAHFVSKKEERIFLEDIGVSNVYAVGVPYLYIDYTEYKDIKRYKNSLLVMPPHSLPQSTHTWDEEKYIQEIKEITSDFSCVVFCIHQNCEEQGLWIESLTKYNIPWILGADVEDENALLRMAKIFNSFEYVTTNNLGSHIVYAAYSGCKVSIYGKYTKLKIEAFKDVEYYQRYPFVLEHALYKLSKEYVVEKYPCLLSHPKDAKLRIEWAAKELGFENQVSYKELAELIGWTKNYTVCEETCNGLALAKNFNKFCAFIEELKHMDKSYVVYGAGAIGKMIASLLQRSDLVFVDQSSVNISEEKKTGKIYSPIVLKTMEYDYIIISVIGREKLIKDYLIEKLNVSGEKILEFKL